MYDGILLPQYPIFIRGFCLLRFTLFLRLSAQRLWNDKRLQKSLQILALIGLTALIFLIFIWGSKPIAIGLFRPPMDKVVHALIYALMLLLANAAFPKANRLILFIAIVVVGVLDEIHQLSLRGRVSDLKDLAADILGCGLMSLVLHYLSQRSKARAQTHAKAHKK